MKLIPQRESVYFLLDDKQEPVALIRNRIMYSVDPLDDEGIARLHNGGDALPLVQEALQRKPKHDNPDH